MTGNSSSHILKNLFSKDHIYYSIPRSPNDVYLDARSGANLFIIPFNKATEFRKVVNTLCEKPFLFGEIDSDTSISTLDLNVVDGVISSDSEVVNQVKNLTVTLLEISNKDGDARIFDYLQNSGNRKQITVKLCERNTSEHTNLISKEFPPIIKICGLKSVEAAERAIDSGANMLGMIMVPNRSRSVSSEVALKISLLVKSHRKNLNEDISFDRKGMSIFDYNSLRIRKGKEGPFLVGVFRNQPLEEVLLLQKKFDLDFVQLHGEEPIEWADKIPVPVIKRFTPGTAEFDQCIIPNYHALSLIDSPLGGEGKLVDRSLLSQYAQLGARFIIAGGLTPENVDSVYSTEGVIGVDVSGGVETNGIKDLKKIHEFVTRAKMQWI